MRPVVLCCVLVGYIDCLFFVCFFLKILDHICTNCQLLLWKTTWCEMCVGF